MIIRHWCRLLSNLLMEHTTKILVMFKFITKPMFLRGLFTQEIRTKMKSFRCMTFISAKKILFYVVFRVYENFLFLSRAYLSLNQTDYKNPLSWILNLQRQRITFEITLQTHFTHVVSFQSRGDCSRPKMLLRNTFS